MKKAICFASKKGGVSKTTSAIITALIMSKDSRVLLIDLDSQNALTSFFFDNYNDIANKTIYEAVRGDIPFKDAIFHIEDNLDVIPSSIEFEEIDNWNHTGKEFILKDEIGLMEGYDYIILDTGPHLKTETILGLVSADIIVIPARLEKMDTRAIDFTLNKINSQIRKHFNPSLKDIYILPTQYNYQNRTVNDVALETLQEEYPDLLLDFKVQYSSKISKLNYIGFNDNIKLKEFPEYFQLAEVIK